jgi:energy-coupling factor transporter ATP-binding protein EcfA2
MSGRIYWPSTSEREERFRVAEARLYGTTREAPEVWTDDTVRDFWVAELQRVVRGDGDAVVLVAGKSGSGKSTLVLDLAWRIDPSFTPATLEEHIAFRPSHVARLYRTVPRYGVGWVDEAAASGLMARDTFSSDQKDLVELIAQIRARNVVLFIIMPHLGELAKGFRARRSDYKLETTAKEETADGRPEAHMGRRVFQRQHFLDDGKWLGFRDDPDANPLRWPDYRTSSDPKHRALWEAYVPLKFRYMNASVETIERRMTEREARRSKKAR